MIHTILPYHTRPYKTLIILKDGKQQHFVCVSYLHFKHTAKVVSKRRYSSRTFRYGYLVTT